ncbi:Myb-like DNA-binding domain containing protein [Trichomonas vaginalis G3]|uniref:Myb-like DNA-binding domain containing protein n=1 Tax=Trichomonas vaginalis (strain ATCC PRA-98 / G3) TaxID=412133 RepID=A2FSV5_TRIV3|nr:RNA polymerase II transcription regulator recruiting protein [Trichomonas vaginalis G3]EAX92006.1 Myb-like DNA-binding domain containing protein [Trichomonas vaginalis G3]KAI5514411.1 RNA polymerase II transcription regulator recruiting protein [Trichomonas vaginalis G3]|eukprot:XP_001304936.1 Myb-like DNA-binding domain containing protein [Trichomonas vaginalis G3]
MNSEKSQSRRRFTQKEDDLLRELAKDKKNKTWEEIAQYLPGRTTCQCRDRYNQYLYTTVISKPWTKEEDELIIEKYKEFGAHWVKIALHLPGRSGTNIKNRWNTALVKYLRGDHKNKKQSNNSKPKKIQKTQIPVADPLIIEDIIAAFEEKALNELDLDSFLKV